jgi:hypothetical protein
MYTLMLIAAMSIPGAILFLVLVAILKQMPEEETARDSARTPQTAPDVAQAAGPAGGFARPAGNVR